MTTDPVLVFGATGAHGGAVARALLAREVPVRALVRDATGVLPLPLPPGTPLHQLALADLGAVMAAILVRRGEHLSQRVELAADAPTPEQMAAAFGVRAVQTPLETVADRSADLAAMYRFLAGPGYGIDVAAVRRRYPEVSFSSFTQWAARQN